MYKVCFDVGLDKVSIKGNTAMDIVMGLCRYQDFDCLLRSARIYEDQDAQAEVDKLEEFIEKMYDNNISFDDLRHLDIHLSLGNFTCKEISECEE